MRSLRRKIITITVICSYFIQPVRHQPVAKGRNCVPSSLSLSKALCSAAYMYQLFRGSGLRNFPAVTSELPICTPPRSNNPSVIDVNVLPKTMGMELCTEVCGVPTAEQQWGWGPTRCRSLMRKPTRNLRNTLPGLEPGRRGTVLA